MEGRAPLNLYKHNPNSDCCGCLSGTTRCRACWSSAAFKLYINKKSANTVCLWATPLMLFHTLKEYQSQPFSASPTATSCDPRSGLRGTGSTLYIDLGTSSRFQRSVVEGRNTMFQRPFFSKIPDLLLLTHIFGHGCASRLVFSEPSLSKTLGFAHFARSVAVSTCAATCSQMNPGISPDRNPLFFEPQRCPEPPFNQMQHTRSCKSDHVPSDSNWKTQPSKANIFQSQSRSWEWSCLPISCSL